MFDVEKFLADGAKAKEQHAAARIALSKSLQCTAGWQRMPFISAGDDTNDGIYTSAIPGPVRGSNWSLNQEVAIMRVLEPAKTFVKSMLQAPQLHDDAQDTDIMCEAASFTERLLQQHVDQDDPNYVEALILCVRART
jgi:hypothetical protein